MKFHILNSYTVDFVIIYEYVQNSTQKSIFPYSKPIVLDGRQSIIYNQTIYTHITGLLGEATFATFQK